MSSYDDRINKLLTSEDSPIVIVNRLTDERDTWTDAQILSELEAFTPLPDEDLFYSTSDWSQIYRYLALTDICARRKLKPAIKLLLDRVCFGDPGETMRGVRHSLEAIVNPDWGYLAQECIACLSSTRPGTRFWAAEELGVLKIKSTIPALEQLLNDPEDSIRETAYYAIEAIQEWGN